MTWCLVSYRFCSIKRLKNLPPTPFCPLITRPFPLSSVPLFSQMRASKCVTDPAVYSQPSSRHLSPWASLSIATVALMACQLWGVLYMHSNTHAKIPQEEGMCMHVSTCTYLLYILAMYLQNGWGRGGEGDRGKKLHTQWNVLTSVAVLIQALK